MKFAMVEVSLTSSNPRLPSVSMDILRGARRLNAETIVYTADPDAYADMPGDLVNRWVVCDTRDGLDVARAAEADRPDCLVGVSDLFVDIANTASLRLGLPASPDSPAFARDKAAVRAALDKAGLRNPRWAVLDCATYQGQPLGPAVPLPGITKPVDGSASWDVSRVADEKELLAAVDHHRARASYGRGVNPVGRLLLEEEIPGELYSVEGFRYDGVSDVWGFTGRVLAEPPNYTELAMSFGADEPVPGLGDYVDQVLDATGFVYGPFHIEVMASPDGPVLIEINPRPMGHGCHQCVDAMADRPFGDEIAGRYLGFDRAFRISDGAACIGHYAIPRGGLITRIDGVDEARGSDGVVKVNVSKTVGDRMTYTASNSDCAAHVIATGEDRDQATRRALDAVNKIRFGFDDGGATA